jgi:uncharacterized protein YoxC
MNLYLPQAITTPFQISNTLSINLRTKERHTNQLTSHLRLLNEDVQVTGRGLQTVVAEVGNSDHIPRRSRQQGS